MLITKPKAKIVEKIIRNKDGNFVRAYFLVAEFEGKIFAKLIRIEPLAKELRITNYELRKEKRVLCLPVILSKSTISVKRFTLYALRSPYFSTIETFFMSQMTRAPSRFASAE